MRKPIQTVSTLLPVPPGGAAEQSGPENAERVADLFRRHNRDLVRFLRARLDDDSEAQEVAQESYVRLLQLQDTQAISFLRAYLFRIAANLATDRLRTRRTAPQVDVSEETLESMSDQLEPERAALSREQLALFLNCLEELPPKCRQVFVMHRLHRLSSRQIAEKLDISTRMVRKHIARALIYCRFRLDGLDPAAALARIGHGQE